MNLRFALIALALVPSCALAFDDELEAPDVDLYFDVQATRNDYGEFGHDWTSGVRLRFGVQFNQARLAGWVWRFEGAYVQFGEAATDSASSRIALPGDPYAIQGEASTVTVTTLAEDTSRLSGFELGARLYDNRLFYVRGGALIHTFKEKHTEQVLVEAADGSPPPTRFFPVPDSDSDSGIAPYLGLGLEVPLGDSLGVTLEYDHYILDNEDFASAAAGISLAF